MLLLPAVLAAESPNRFDPKVQEYLKTFKSGGELGNQSPAPALADELKQFKVADGLVVYVVASEPVIRQPLNLHFDERGRLWVVQYLQYPFPAGLKIVKYDQYLRAVYDRVPPPPPNHFKGLDRITILEDPKGDGVFSQAKDFVSDLNMARSVVTGRGGVWVLNPPYLLFYPDKNRDDIPDSDPEVALVGFGLEDTHSGANSLAWGPDGWLYGAHGSTCTADVNGVKFLGQAIWRYQPTTRAFEVFAEGGGNTYCVEFDAEGRCFSGSNYDNTRGLHYAQGGCYIKNWGKHGPLMNPYAFGWFEHMSHTGYKPRFPQTMLIYEGGAIPQLEGQLIAGMALTSRYQASRLSRDTSSFRTDDTEVLIDSPDRHFRPVDTKTGPEGAIYIADWCDSRLSHLDPRDTWDKATGRLWRLKAGGALSVKPFDIAKINTDELIQLLSHPNKWWRQMALRVFWDRHDPSAVPALSKLVARANGQLALEAFWALNASGGFDNALALKTLQHPNKMVRYWTIRLLGDSGKISPAIQTALIKLAFSEPDAEVRSQLASSLKRLPGRNALSITHELLLRTDDAGDKHIPLLLWWALESKCASDRELVLKMFQDRTFWQTPIVSRFIVSRLGRRYAAERNEKNLETCAQFLALAPTSREVDELVKGMAEGLQGDPVKTVPPSLQRKVGEIWASRPPTPTLISFALRLGYAPATQGAIQKIANSEVPETERRELVQLLSERREPAAVPVMLDQLRRDGSLAWRLELVNSLQRFDQPEIAQALLELSVNASPELKAAAQTALSSRVLWARQLLEAVNGGRLKKEHIPMANVLAIQGFKDTTCDALIQKHWGRLSRSSEEKERQVAQVREFLAAGKGDEQQGRVIFQRSCSTCHTLNGEGAKIGPDLTGYERDNLDFILPAIVDPSLAIREEYTAFNVETKDGQTITGFIVEQTPSAVTLTDVSGKRLVLPRRDIENLQASALSLMPEGLLDPLQPQEVRDLFAYLRKQR
ncbi:MAG: c-type cytochrome [Verrucomicrobia bacterium]|nr:c-type cytochrome [Verrucomicrobiota bacterium]